jgi:hypothetical protein
MCQLSRKYGNLSLRFLSTAKNTNLQPVFCRLGYEYGSRLTCGLFLCSYRLWERGLRPRWCLCNPQEEWNLDTRLAVFTSTIMRQRGSAMLHWVLWPSWVQISAQIIVILSHSFCRFSVTLHDYHFFLYPLLFVRIQLNVNNANYLQRRENKYVHRKTENLDTAVWDSETLSRCTNGLKLLASPRQLCSEIILKVRPTLLLARSVLHSFLFSKPEALGQFIWSVSL